MHFAGKGNRLFSWCYKKTEEMAVASSIFFVLSPASRNGAQLINYSITEGFAVQYWRERKEEVDFILEKKGMVIGLEVKSGTAQSSSGIAAFKKAFNFDKVLSVGNSGLPWPDFLKMNPVELF